MSLTRPLTALKLLRKGRWDDLRVALRHRAVPKPLYFNNELLFVRLDELRSVSLDLSHIEVRRANPADVPLLQKIRPRADRYAPAFARQDICLLAMSDQRPAAMAWFNPRDKHVSVVNGYEMHLGTEGCYSYGVEVHPDFRMTGAVLKLWQVCVDDLAKDGLTKIYAAIPTENPLSIKSHTRLGFKPLARFSTHRLLGTRRHTLVPESGPAQRGWSRLAWRDL